MVIVRESPRVQQSPNDKETQWPPKSPFEALMSSPSSRKKWQNHADRMRDRTPSPSPLRRPMQSPGRAQRQSFSSDEDEEDEEMVQLRLAEIQAKLKIKELQRKARRSAKDASLEGSSTLLSSTTASRENVQHSPKPTKVEVPLSPVRMRQSEQPYLSPARKRLGLQDVKKAEDISLKRGPKITTTAHARSHAPVTERSGPRPLTFSERLAASNSDARAEEAKRDRIDKARTAGFGNARTTFSQAKTMIERRSDPLSTGNKRPASSYAAPSSNSHASLFTNPAEEKPAPLFKSIDVERKQPQSTAERKAITKPAHEKSLIGEDETQPSSFDPHSEIHLSKRHITHVEVAREMDGREIYTLPRLLKEVKAPHYEPPECESDFVVFAILASKSTPYQQKATHRTSDELEPQEDASAPRNKFMVFKLCDLKWEVDCFLFGTAFDQFWKLTPGTLIAILNPGIMAPKNNAQNGRFSLKLGSSEDCVMEIGVARDLGYCDSMKKDGQQCTEWVDKRSTQICEFHLNLLIDRERKGRMEVNTMFRGVNSGENKYRNKSRNLGEKGFDKLGKKNNSYSHAEYGRLYSVPTGFGRSAANLLDREDPDALHGMTREEASRKRIAAAEKERDLAKRLAQIGNGAGAEYLRVTHNITSDRPVEDQRHQGVQDLFDKPKACDLGLLDNKATEIRLSPAKDRKRHFGLGISASTTTAGGAQAMGWGGAKKAGLLQPKESRMGSSERGQTRLDSAIRPRAALVRERSSDGSLSPKKRARFALERGVREPGRDSLGGDDLKALSAPTGSGKDAARGHEFNDDDDDDDLDIV